MGMPGFKPDTETRTPVKYARNWGSAKSGAGHWWTQRVTAAALILLGIWFVVTVLRMVGSDFAAAHELIARPWNAVLLIAFVATACWHAQLGLEVVIEDYVHVHWKEVVLVVLVKFLAVLLALASAVAVLRITLGG